MKRVFFPWTHRNGKRFERRGKARKVIFLCCDKCWRFFKRNSGLVAINRRDYDCKHFCDDCKDPALFADLGRAAYKNTLKKRIGEKVVDSLGYIRIYVGDTHPYSNGYCGSIREHIMVMECHLGRAMKKGEVVHHIDGDKTNNKLDNLDFCTVQEHNACHGASELIVFELYKKGLVGYDRPSKRYYFKG